MANDYTRNRKAKNLDEIRKIEKELPLVVTEFMQDSEIQTLTSSSRLGYIRDLRTFFYFLPRERAAFADTPPNKISIEQLNGLRKVDFDAYSDYLNSYIKPLYGHNDAFIIDEHAPYSKSSKVKGTTTNEASGKARKIVAVRRFFKYLFENNKIETNYAERLKVPPVKDKEIIYLKKDEIARVLEVVKNGFGEKKQAKFLEHSRVRDYAIMSLLLGTGIRASECVGLDFQHIDLKEKSIKVTRKGEKEMELYMSASTAEALEEYLAERAKITPVKGYENAVFLSSQRKRMTTRALQNLVKKYATVACPTKEHLSPHKMRSSFGTQLYHKKGIEAVANVLGHSNINTTKKHYVHTDKEERKESANEVDWV